MRCRICSTARPPCRVRATRQSRLGIGPASVVFVCRRWADGRASIHRKVFAIVILAGEGCGGSPARPSDGLQGRRRVGGFAERTVSRRGLWSNCPASGRPVHSSGRSGASGPAGHPTCHRPGVAATRTPPGRHWSGERRCATRRLRKRRQPTRRHSRSAGNSPTSVQPRRRPGRAAHSGAAARPTGRRGGAAAGRTRASRSRACGRRCARRRWRIPQGGRRFLRASPLQRASPRSRRWSPVAEWRPVASPHRSRCRTRSRSGRRDWRRSRRASGCCRRRPRIPPAHR